MKLKLIRIKYDHEGPRQGTISEFYINGERKYYIMEDKDRQLEIGGCATKIAKQTAIPRGTYKVIIDFSQRYQRDMPHVLDVPCFTGIRIHVGNYDGDTEGCLLIGLGYETKPEFMVTNSKKAFDEFFPILKDALNNGEEVTLEVV